MEVLFITECFDCNRLFMWSPNCKKVLIHVFWGPGGSIRRMFDCQS